jgi:hypothetical protein
MHFLLLICDKFKRAQLAHQIFSIKSTNFDAKCEAQFSEKKIGFILSKFEHFKAKLNQNFQEKKFTFDQMSKKLL